MRGPPAVHSKKGLPFWEALSTAVVQFSSRHTAEAAMPSPLPVKPRPSSVVAFTLTWERDTPQAFGQVSRIWEMRS